jgi:hypothetical protein
MAAATIRLSLQQAVKAQRRRASNVSYTIGSKLAVGWSGCQALRADLPLTLRKIPERLTIHKSKPIPVTGRGGPQGCEMLSIPYCVGSRVTDGGEVVRPDALYASETLLFCCWYSFLLEAE